MDAPPEPHEDAEQRLYLPMDQWVNDRLRAQMQQSIRDRYEHSTYEILNTLLSSQFPSSQMFMVKRQGAYRHIVQPVVQNPPPSMDNLHDQNVAPEGDGDALASEESDDEQAGGNTLASLNISDANTSGGGTGGRFKYIPDFVVVKAGASLSTDVALCIVEVKRDRMDMEAAGTRLIDYLMRASQEPYAVGSLTGILILGEQAVIYVLDAETYRSSGYEKVTIEVIDSMSSYGGDFKQFLFSISERYWGQTRNEWRQFGYRSQFEPIAN